MGRGLGDEANESQRGVPGSLAALRMLDDVIVRPLKDDLRQMVGRFPKREVVQVTIDNLPNDAPELRLTALLDQYGRLREQRLPSP